MNSVKEIRERDAASADTWFKEPALGACGRAFIDRRWLLAEADRLRVAIDKALEWCYRENVCGHVRNELEIASSSEPQPGEHG